MPQEAQARASHFPPPPHLETSEVSHGAPKLGGLLLKLTCVMAGVSGIVLMQACGDSLEPNRGDPAMFVLDSALFAGSGATSIRNGWRGPEGGKGIRVAIRSPPQKFATKFCEG